MPPRCSTAGLLHDNGVEPARIVGVSGGLDSRAFRPLPGARAAARAALGLPGDAQLLLTVCRLVEKKGVEVLPEALAQRGLLRAQQSFDGSAVVARHEAVVARALAAPRRRTTIAP
jgi:hypothetical protein